MKMNRSMERSQETGIDERLQERESALPPPGEDTLFKSHEVYHGPAPADLSERHDDYLYGDEKS